MLSRLRLALLAAFVVVGCDSTTPSDGGPGPTDGGEPTDGSSSIDAGPPVDAGPPSDAGPTPDGGVVCGDPDTTCPASLPFPGAPCAVGLTCDYPEAEGTWMYTCPAGRWEATSTCTAPPGGACPVPPLGETCDMPFGGTLAGATVEIGPATGAFRPFMDRETVAPIFGGQGSPMLQYRLRIGGVDAPECIRAVTTLSAAVIEPVSEPRTIRVRCDETLGVLSIVPGGMSCPKAPVETQLSVQITGIGMATVTLMLPAEAYCPPLRG